MFETSCDADGIEWKTNAYECFLDRWNPGDAIPDPELAAMRSRLERYSEAPRALEEAISCCAVGYQRKETFMLESTRRDGFDCPSNEESARGLNSMRAAS